ncbi:TonB-dependent receptor [Alistipes sp. OttesenSCG-928-B03]|nr:TonB-dependent receptor [Alistipes sp. OttesenSCG-928-B03]
MCTAATSYAQRGTIKGTVVDAKTGEPLAGTTVIIEGTTIGTSADANGHFTISNVVPGACSIYTYYLGYEIFWKKISVEPGKEVEVLISLASENITMDEVVVVAQINHEAENVVMSEQKESVVATQSVGAVEMSRKGLSDAKSVVAQVSGISKQEGVKNVSVRGLGDRYNATFLNGFPVPSEDPEYKNIALDFFGTDVISNINVNKVFTADNNGDVAGAVIDIRSKKLYEKQALSVDLGVGVNSSGVGADFLRQDGVNYWGVSNAKQPEEGDFGFGNSLDPSKVKLPMNHSYGISGGKRFEFGDQRNSLSFFVTASHSSDYAYTQETVRNANAAGDIFQDQKGERSAINTDQLVLANVDLRIGRSHGIEYNFMLIHANEQYVGDYLGLHTEKHQDSEEGMGYLRRQQSNDNRLMTHQLISKWSLTERIVFDVGAACNTIKGAEPDRRENYLSLQDDGLYTLTGSNRQKRFFSDLEESDLNLKAGLRYKLKRDFDIEKSNVTLGYRGRFVENDFSAVEYNFGRYAGSFSIDGLKLDGIYNSANYEAGRFAMNRGDENSYHVTKNIHSGYAEITHPLCADLTINAGIQADYIDMSVDYNVQHSAPGRENITKTYFLPSLSLKYDFADNHSLRMGASKSYTLPQSKEISPYQYVDIGFVSQGNPNLKPSDNYNVDLKWDWYLTSSEFVSLGAFYKYISDPIGRVDQANSAGLLTYDNISSSAMAAGVEFEVRKNIFTRMSRSRVGRLSVGMNASYIYSSLDLDIPNTVKRKTELEGASPFLVNGDISYQYTSGGGSKISLSLVAGYFSDRICTLGTQDFNDTIEEGAVSLGAVASWKIKAITLKLKAGNLLDPSYRLTRKIGQGDSMITLKEYKKGMDFSFGISFDL